MSRKVLLVDSDVIALGALASALRARGLTVSNASEAFDAVEEAFRTRPDVVLAARAPDVAPDDLRDAFRVVPELAHTPLLYLVRAGQPGELAPDEVVRADLDQVISRIIEISPRAERLKLDQEIRGDLEQMSLVDLLQFLAMNRKSGVLGLTTAAGAGEVRLAEGEVIDAVYRRLEGEKALYRLLGEHAGRFAFSAGDPSAVRRITSPTSHLLMEALRQVDEARRRRRELAPAGEAFLINDAPPPAVSGREALTAALGLNAPGAALARDLTALLQIPRGLDEILDDLAASDLAVLDALAALVLAGRVRRIPLAELTTPLAPPEQMPVLRSLVTRLTRAGFAPPPRLVIAAAAHRLPALAHSVRRITDASAPGEAPPRAPLPRLLGTLRLGDGVELALTGLPGDEAFAPTWTLALPGAAAVVRLGDAGGLALEAHCQAVEVTLIDAESLMGALDVAVPGQVAALVRSALEMTAGV
jgi:CheY-like chemotaxis protein